MPEIQNSPLYTNEEASFDGTLQIEHDIEAVTHSKGGITSLLHVLPRTYRGSTELRLNNLPAGLKVFHAEATEIDIHTGLPYRGGAVVFTTSVNLHSDQRFAVIRFNVSWRAPLKTGLMILMS